MREKLCLFNAPSFVLSALFPILRDAAALCEAEFCAFGKNALPHRPFVPLL